MMHTLLYSEMNQSVPGGNSLSPGHESGYGSECQVPSPSQWSDPCYSPPSFHSPQHLPVELEKVKEEPFSPSSFSPSSNASYLSLPASPPPNHLSPASAVPIPPNHHGASPYGRPSSGGGGHVMKKDAYESCLNLSDLLNENHNLIQQHHSSSASPPYGGVYPDHPLLRGRLEDVNAFSNLSPAGGSPPPPPPSYEGSPSSHHHHPHHLDDFSAYRPKMTNTPSPNAAFNDASDDGLSFLESLVDVKHEVEDDVNVGSSCGSPAVPSPSGAGGQQQQEALPQQQPQQQQQQQQQQSQVPCQRDILETVEILAQEHNRRDVQRVSDSLNIPRDPAQWSVEDVRAWLKLQASQLNLPPLMLDFWNYGGPSLLKLTEHQFRQLAPIGGELLYAKLEIWREALKSAASPKLSVVSSMPSSPSSTSSASSPIPPSVMSPDLRHAYAFLHHNHQVAMSQQEPSLMLLSSHHAAAHLHHFQQQQHVGGLPSGGSSPSGGTAPASPPLGSSLAQVPTPVAQVSQQQQGNTSPAPLSPREQQGTPTSSGVYLEEPCLDMAALLQQPASTPKGAPTLGAHKPSPTHCPQQEDAYDSEEEVEEETCSSSSGGNGGGGSGRGGTHIHLWQFLKELLQQPQLYGSCIRWLDRQKGVFKIEDSVRVARLWGKRKNRPAMNYDKLSRSIRQYYKKGIMKKTERSQRLVYQFCHPYCL